MHFGIMFANTMDFASGPGALELARQAELAGFESLWTVEHVIYPDSYESAYPYAADGKMPAKASTPIPDPLIWLAYVAGVTTRLRLGTGILILPQRNPLILAKEVATLDSLSGGRVELGIGVGWLREEFDAIGVPWERRGERTDDYIRAMRALWAADHADHEGDFARFANVSSNPKPTNGDVRIVVGGHSKAAARRAGLLGDGFFPGKGTPDELTELFDIVRQTAADAGRDPAVIEMTVGGPFVRSSDPVGEVQRMADLGVDRLVFPAFAFLKPDIAEACAAFGESVIAPCS